MSIVNAEDFIFNLSSTVGGELAFRFGLEGEEIGKAIAEFKDYFQTDGFEFEEFVLGTDSERLYKIFKAFYFEESK